MDFLKKLKSESHKWVEIGLISSTQREEILKLYPEKKEGYQKSSFILKSLSALFLGLAFFLLIGANWKHFPLWLRSGIVFLPLVLSHVMVFYFWKKDSPVALSLWGFFASLLLGANIFFQAQIFHIINPYYNGLLGWMIGILPILFWLKTKPLAYLYLFLQVLHIFSLNLAGKPTYLWHLFYLPNLVLYVKNPTRPYFFSLLLSSLINLAIFLTQKDGSAYFLSFVLGLWGYALTVNLGLQGDIKFRLFFLWYLYFLVYLLIFYDLATILFTGFLSLPLVLGFIGALFLIFFSKTQYLEKIFLGLGSLIIVVLKAIFSEGSESALLTTTWIFNLFILFSSLYLLYFGFRTQKKGLFFMGLTFLLSLAFGRYLSLVKDYLTTALLFVILAILLWFLNQRWEKLYAKK